MVFNDLFENFEDILLYFYVSDAGIDETLLSELCHDTLKEIGITNMRERLIIIKLGRRTTVQVNLSIIFIESKFESCMYFC